jgi:hypothetical protein
MGTEEPTAPDSGWDVQTAIAFVRATGLLKHLDSSPNENIEETVVEIDDAWDVRLSTVHASGEAVCYRLIVEPRGTSQRGWTASLWRPPGGITSSLLRKIPVASILDVLDQVRAGEREGSTGRECRGWASSRADAPKRRMDLRRGRSLRAWIHDEAPSASTGCCRRAQ